MTDMAQLDRNPGTTLWHIVIDLAYEGGEDDSVEDGVKKVLSTLAPATANGSGIKNIIIMRLPEKDSVKQCNLPDSDLESIPFNIEIK